MCFRHSLGSIVGVMVGSIVGVLRGSRACHAHADTAGTACVSCMCMAAYAAGMCEG